MVSIPKRFVKVENLKHNKYFLSEVHFSYDASTEA